MKFMLRIVQKVPGTRTRTAEFTFTANEDFETLRKLVIAENILNETDLEVHIEEQV